MDEIEREDVLVLAHDVAVLAFILGTMLGIPLLLLTVGITGWIGFAVGLALSLLLVLPLVALRAHRPRTRPGPWPTDLHGRPVGRWYDALGLDQPKGRASLTGVPDQRWHRRIIIGRNDACPCGSGEPFKVCCAHRGWRHFLWVHGGKYGLYE